MCSSYLTKSSTNNLNYFGSISEGNWLFGTSLMVILPIYVKLNLKAWLQPLKEKKDEIEFYLYTDDNLMYVRYCAQVPFRRKIVKLNI